MKKLFIGTSGYNYRDWRVRFYPENLPQKEWLGFYSKHFNTVEINATFYRSFPKSTFENWHNQTSRKFSFCLKGPRFITHIKRLKDVGSSVDLFFYNASGLKEKLGMVLWQFPSNFKLNEENKKRFKHFLTLLRHPEFISGSGFPIRSGMTRGIPKPFGLAQDGQVRNDKKRNLRHAFELRDSSWFTEDVFDLLDRENMGFVISDSPIFPSREVVTGDFAYIRFHGPGSLYSSSYSSEELNDWSKKIKKYLKNFEVYCYFNNDASGFAVRNAITLRNLIRE